MNAFAEFLRLLVWEATAPVHDDGVSTCASVPADSVRAIVAGDGVAGGRPGERVGCHVHSGDACVSKWWEVPA